MEKKKVCISDLEEEMLPIMQDLINELDKKVYGEYLDMPDLKIASEILANVGVALKSIR